MDIVRLVVPALEHEEAATAFADEVMKFDGEGIHGSAGLSTANAYAEWLDTISRSAAGESIPYLSPSETYFAIRTSDNTIAGIVNIRFALDSEFMTNYGGHIGYTVHPTERRKGYATQILRLSLVRCRELGIDRVLITADPQNTASCRTIEKCGGVMENEIPYPDTDELVRRYWFDLRKGEL